MEWTFAAQVIEWRGPAPYLFAPMSEAMSAEVKDAARGMIYWGQVPVVVTIKKTVFTTALFPKDGRYLVPIKVSVQRAENIGPGSRVRLRLRIGKSW